MSSLKMAVYALLLSGCTAKPMDADSIKTLTDACLKQDGIPRYFNGLTTYFECIKK